MNFRSIRFLLIIISLTLCFVSCGEDEGSENLSGDGDLEVIETSEDGDTTELDSEESKETFPPESQQAFYEKGLILPPHSLECVPVDTGVPQMECNHHGSSVAEMPDGTVIAVWYHGECEKCVDSQIVWSKLLPGSEKWTDTEVLYDDPDYSDGNLTLWVDDDSTIYVVFVTLYDFDWAKGKIRLIKSEDEGETWSDPIFIREEPCWNVRNHPVKLANGEILIPCYDECTYLPVYLRTDDKFETWQEESNTSGEYFMDHIQQIQPALVVLDDGTVSAVTRDHSAVRRIKRMTSSDNGLTWTPSIETGLPNSGTGIDQVRLLDGNVVVVFNNHPFNRFPLTVALSRDGGETFVAMRDINAECDEGNCSYSYPSIMQSQTDGNIWVTYTHKRETIGYVKFNEAWILESEVHANISCLRGKSCQDGSCFEGCQSDDDCDENFVCYKNGCRLPCSSTEECTDEMQCNESGFCAFTLDEDRVDQACTEYPEEAWN